MTTSITGSVVDERRLRVGFIGCGSHSFRNIYPTFQFAPVELVATCDLDGDRAAAYARQFGAERWYTDHRTMLEAEDLEAVFIVTGHGDDGRPLYPTLATDCLRAGRHVWTEKPPAATTADIERLKAEEARADRQVMVGFKKMFFPANEHALRLSGRDDFGTVTQATTHYPMVIPTPDEFRRYLDEHEPVEPVVDFLDHLCHPASTLLLLMGPPTSLYFRRSWNGAGTALLSYASGAIATLGLIAGAAAQDGLERTTVIADRGAHIVVDNNIRVTLHRMPYLGYGDVTDFYATDPEHSTVVWEPEFSLGQLYNKGLFLLGYYNEVDQFARAVLDGRPVPKANLTDAWHLTKLFEAFAEGPDRCIDLTAGSPVGC